MYLERLSSFRCYKKRTWNNLSKDSPAVGMTNDLTRCSCYFSGWFLFETFSVVILKFPPMQHLSSVLGPTSNVTCFVAFPDFLLREVCPLTISGHTSVQMLGYCSVIVFTCLSL